jgi:HK97 family phage major capsid protein
MGEKIFKQFDMGDAQIKSIDEKERVIWHPITREVPDRYGDIVRVDGMDASEFARKPAVLYGHDYQGKNPVTIIGENIGFKVEGGVIYAGTRFLATEGLSQPLADLINDNWLLQTKKLMGWSIGFIPTEMAEILDGGKFKGYDFKKWKLLEYSSVIIPAHQDAVNDSIAKGIISGEVVKQAPTPEGEPVTKTINQTANGIEPPVAGKPEGEPEPKAPAISKNLGGKMDLKTIKENLAAGKKLEQDEIDYLEKLAAQEAENNARGVKAPPARQLELVDDPNVRVRSMSKIVSLQPRLLSDEEKELQKFNDDMLILSTILKKNPRELKMWEDRFAGSSALRKALDTATSAEGSQWIPTILSADIIAQMKLEAKVAALFPEYVMPSNPWKRPYFGGIDSDNFYLVGESTTDSPTASPASTPATGDVTFTASKLKARILFSDEIAEDSIVPVLATLKADLAKAGARVKEDVIINGDTTATHQDSDVTSSQDRRKAFKGLRKLCPAGTQKADLSTFSSANVLALITGMGKYGVNPSDLAFITGAKSFNKFRANSDVLTVDKYGPQAVLLNGELAKFFGSPILVSEYIRQNLNNSGVYDGSTTDKTQFLIVYRPGFALGIRGGVKLTFLSEGQVDQNQLIMSFRSDFQPLWTPSTTIATIGMGYKVS